MDSFTKERLSLALLHRELDELLSAEKARALEAEIARALEKGSSQALARVAQSVMQTPAEERFRELLSQEHEMLMRGFPTISGDADPITVEVYVCPRDHCHYSRYRFFVNDPIPRCPEHDILLIPREEASC